MITLQELITGVDVGLIYGIAAIGVYLTFRTINFSDMTCDGSFVLGAAVSATLIKSGVNPFLALSLSLIFGGIAGLCTGILNVKFKISDLLSGIIVAFVLYSINLRIMGGAPNITLVDEPTAFSVVNPIFAIIALLIFCLIYTLFSGFGLRLRAIGYNKQFASVSGVNVKAMTIIGLTLSNSLIAFSGGLFSQYQGFCDISQGMGTLVAGLASVVIGERLLPFKKEPLIILSCVIGSILYRIFISLALQGDAFGIKPQDLNLIAGLIMIAVMALKRNKQNA